jgi:hypothetical protein
LSKIKLGAINPDFSTIREITFVMLGRAIAVFGRNYMRNRICFVLVSLVVAFIACPLAIFIIGRASAQRLESARLRSSALQLPLSGFVDAGKFGSIQAAINSVPANGGTVFVPQGMPLDASGLTIATPLHLLFDCEVFTYSGSKPAIAVTSPGGVQLEGCAAADENNPRQGTAFILTNPSATGLDVRSSNGFIARNLSFVGSGKGSGVGVHVSGNGFQLYGVQADSFGGDGFQIDGVRSNTNNFLLERVRSHKNGGRGFYTFGRDSNVGVWIQTFAQGNSGTQYSFENTAGHIFAALSAEAQKDTTSISFVASWENHGSVYIEPAAPFTSPAITLDAASKNNNLILLNGRKVSDAGTGNRYYLGAVDFSPPVRNIQNTDTNVEGALNPTASVARAGHPDEQAIEGIWFGADNLRSGYVLRENGAMNFVFDMNGRGSGVNFLHRADGSNIGTAVPVFHIDEKGVSFGGGSAIRSVWKSGATLNFARLQPHTCQDLTTKIEGAAIDAENASANASPAAALGSTSLSWQAAVTGNEGQVSVRLCNVGDQSVQPRPERWNVAILQ